MKSEAEITKAVAILVGSLALVGNPENEEEAELLHSAKIATAVLQWLLSAGKGEELFQNLLDGLERDLREAIEQGKKDDKARHIN